MVSTLRLPKILLLAFSVIFTFNLADAQDKYVATHEGWFVDVDEAFAKSKKTGRPIPVSYTHLDVYKRQR